MIRNVNLLILDKDICYYFLWRIIFYINIWFTTGIKAGGKHISLLCLVLKKVTNIFIPMFGILKNPSSTSLGDHPSALFLMNLFILH